MSILTVGLENRFFPSCWKISLFQADEEAENNRYSRVNTRQYYIIMRLLKNGVEEYHVFWCGDSSIDNPLEFYEFLLEFYFWYKRRINKRQKYGRNIQMYDKTDLIISSALMRSYLSIHETSSAPQSRIISSLGKKRRDREYLFSSSLMLPDSSSTRIQQYDNLLASLHWR